MNRFNFNFDLLFDGSIEQQSRNVHAFMRGVDRAQNDVRRNLALSILRGDGGLNYIAQLSEIEDMIKTFDADPRVESLAAQLTVLNKKKTEVAREKLGKQIAEELSKVL